jgi:hypothetical protein
MASMTTAEANSLATKAASDYAYAALYTTAPTQTAAGTEVTGGSPAYARQALTWSAASGGAITASATFQVPADTIVGTGFHSAATGGNYLHGYTFGTSFVFSAQGTLTVSYTFTEA